jgi:hypothetical protein
VLEMPAVARDTHRPMAEECVLASVGGNLQITAAVVEVAVAGIVADSLIRICTRSGRRIPDGPNIFAGPECGNPVLAPLRIVKDDVEIDFVKWIFILPGRRIGPLGWTVLDGVVAAAAQ